MPLSKLHIPYLKVLKARALLTGEGESFGGHFDFSSLKVSVLLTRRGEFFGGQFDFSVL